MSAMSKAGLWAAVLCVALAAPAAALPYGSYQQSCKDIKLKDRDSDSARIQARCIDNQGEWRKTSFELDRCWGDLANIDGELVCVADQRYGGNPGFSPGYPGQGNPGQGYPPPGYGRPSGYGPPPGKPKDVAVDVCSEWAVRAAYADGATYAQMKTIEDVDRKDAGRIKVKGVVLASRERDDRKMRERPFRCDSRQGQIIEFKWR